MIVIVVDAGCVEGSAKGGLEKGAPPSNHLYDKLTNPPPPPSHMPTVAVTSVADKKVMYGDVRPLWQ